MTAERAPALRLVRAGGRGRRAAPVLVTVAVLALANRLVPVLRGGGLDGVLGYDDAVYYAGAVGMVHGRLPYADFLLLHPPGVLLALAPVAGWGRIVGETAGWETSRLLWMSMGCVTSVIVSGSLLRLGRWAALVGGGAYAVFPAAVLVERTTMVEGLTNLCLAGALALVIAILAAPPASGDVRRIPYPYPALCLAGCLLGFSAATKIWGVVPLAVIAVFVAVVLGVRYGLALVGAGAAVIVAVCLPFFVAAPAAMWQMVALDQLRRSQGTSASVRVAQILTLGRSEHLGVGLVAGGVVLAAAIACSVLAWRLPAYRVVVPVLAGMAGLLVMSPIFFPHYVAILAVPGALLVGVAVGQLVRDADPLTRRRVLLIGGCVLVALDLLALVRIRSGSEVPIQLREVVQPAPGCLTADDPNNLLSLGVVGRNVRRGCELVVDLGGYSHHLSPGRHVTRSRNTAWQTKVIDYLETGEYALVIRFAGGRGLSRSTALEIESWPVRHSVEGFDLRQPP